MATISPAHAAVQPNAFSNAPSLDAKSFQGLSAEQCFCPDWIYKNRWDYPIATNGKGGKSAGHRLAYRLFIGPILNGTMVLHGNTKAAVQLPQNKLTDEDVRAIRACSESCTALAKRYGMSRSYMWCVRTGAARNEQKVEV